MSTSTGIMSLMKPDQQYIRDRSFVAPDTCWIWERSVNDARGGYGMASWKDQGLHRIQSAHKLAYELFRGPVPRGLELDHVVCQQKVCCNPHHLEIVTPAENQRRNVERGVSSNQNVGKTCCGKCGGPFDMIKKVRNGTDRRICGECYRAYYREWRAKRKAGD